MDVLTAELNEPRIGHDVMASARVEWFKILAWRIGIAVVGLALWEAVSGRLIKSFWISAPSAIWAQLMAWVDSGDLWMHVEITLTETILGFVFGAVSGIAVGLALGLNKRLAAVLDPFIIAF